jgi:selenocysteine lyase/cysteine desulfurase
VSGLEHHALSRPAELLSSRGVERVVVPPAPPEPIDLGRLEAELARGRVRLVAVTAACNVTGERLPVERIVALAHAQGALCLVDAAQLAGWEPLECDRLGADLVAFAGHKGPQGPRGIGGLYVAPGLSMRSPAASCDAPATRACAAMPGYCDVGSLDRVALAGLAAGLRWLAEPARAQRLAEARGRIARLAAAVADLPGFVLHGPSAAEARMPTLAVTCASRSPAQLARDLAARGIVASAGLQCAPLAHASLGTAPEGVLRLSVGVGNGDADVDAAAEALRAVAA